MKENQTLQKLLQPGKWLALFLFSAAVLVTAAVFPMVWELDLIEILDAPLRFDHLAILSFVLLLLWLEHADGDPHWQPGTQKGLKPAGIVLGLLVLAGAVLLWAAALALPADLLLVHLSPNSWTSSPFLRKLYQIVWLVGRAAAVAGLWGLVQLRRKDRRYGAVYVLGLTTVALCVHFSRIFSCKMSHGGAYSIWACEGELYWGTAMAAMGLFLAWVIGREVLWQGDYMALLTWEARWRMSPQEAQEVIADYAELLEQDGRSQAELVRDFGPPRQAVRLLCSTRDARRRQVLFWALLLVGILPACWLFTSLHHFTMGAVCMILGAILSWIWSRSTPKQERLPRGMLLLLGIQVLLALAGGVAVWLTFRGILLELTPPAWVGFVISVVLEAAGLGSLLLGLWGLIQARLTDRRWRAVYVLGLTIGALALLVLSVLHGLSLDVALPFWHRPYTQRGLLTALAGLVLTGVALC